MFRFEGLGAENRRDAHRPTLTPPWPHVMANQDTVSEPGPRISFCGLGARFVFSGRKRRVNFGAIACHVRGKLARPHPITTQDCIDAHEIGVSGETPPEIEITGKPEIRIDAAGLLPQSRPPEIGFLLDERPPGSAVENTSG